MKLRAEVDGTEYLLEWSAAAAAGGDVTYRLTGAASTSGTASVTTGTSGVYSVLLGPNSYAVSVMLDEGQYIAEIGGRRYRVGLADARDRSAKLKKQAVSGPVELRAQMPGKVVKFLVASGAAVQAGESLVVVEAMKMQNEVKAPKDGVIGRIFVEEGVTVAAGEPLLRLE